MNAKRLWHTFRLWLIGGAGKRARYLRKKKLFASVGEDCSYMPRIIPLYAKLIKMGNHVHIASDVVFVTHDVTHHVLNSYLASNNTDAPKIQEKMGCIEISNNVFIGAKTMILPNVRIGSNVIVGAGSIVTRDLPDNCVAVGTPAKPIGTFQDFLNKRLNEQRYEGPITVQHQDVLEEWVDCCWKEFYHQREQI
ncbi:MAG: acyltransferase [Clostridia bacterium]|nr:acyltransferase [Clostridia bacterium]MBR4502303.1 acyltransferase [Clostridia bacterium]